MSISRSNLRFYGSTDDLGGPMTSRRVTGHGLFPTVSGLQAEQGLVDHRCIYFVNDDTDEDGLIDAYVWFERPTHGLEVGFDPVGQNETAQSIVSGTDRPVAVAFSAPTESRLPLYLPGKAYHEGDFIALWFRRTTPAGSRPEELHATLHVGGETY